MKNYQIYFSFTFLFLYFIQLLPNIIWVVYPPVNNILAQNEAPFVWLDILEHILGVLIVFSMVFLHSTKQGNPVTKYIIIAALCAAGYYICWIAYYLGCRESLLFLCMAVFPPCYFISLSLWQRNYICMIICILFAFCHIAITCINYL